MDKVKDIFDEIFSKHEEEIKALFPETWTHFSNINKLPIHYKLKAIGFNFKNNDELASVWTQLEIKKLILRDGMLVKRNHHKVYCD